MGQHIGIWMRENPFLTFILLLALGSGLTECGVEFAKAMHR